MSVTVKLPVFEGPLDLLLHLIEKNQVDICDIPIYEITKQYLEYLDEWNQENMVIASEFIVMAATLIKIKARMLIPSEPKEADEEDPRDELIRRLLEYKRFKEAAKDLKKLIPDPNKLWITRSRESIKIPAPKPSIEQLLNGLTLEAIYEMYRQALQNKADSIDPTRSTFNTVAKDSYTIDSKIRDLLDTLEHLQTISFYQLREQSHSRQEEITYFLAMLELNRSSLVYLKQENPFEDIFMIPVDSEAENEDASNEQQPEEITSETENDNAEVPESSKEVEVTEMTEITDDTENVEMIEVSDTTEETEMTEITDDTENVEVIEVFDTTEESEVIEIPDAIANVEVIEVSDITEETEVVEVVEAPTENKNEMETISAPLEMVAAAMTVSIPTITIEPSDQMTPAPENLEPSEEAIVIEKSETTDTVSYSVETADTVRIVEADGSIEATDTAEVIDESVESTDEIPESSETIKEAEIEAIQEAEVEATEIADEVVSPASNVIEVDFSSSVVTDVIQEDEDGSEYTERIVENERGYSDPKKARAAGA